MNEATTFTSRVIISHIATKLCVFWERDLSGRFYSAAITRLVNVWLSKLSETRNVFIIKLWSK
jgi:hypothetical protein